MATLSFEIILSSRIKVPSKSVTYKVFIIKIFYLFRDHNIYAIPVRNSAAIAVKFPVPFSKLFDKYPYT